MVIGYIENPLTWAGWPEARALLARAAQHGDHTMDEIEAWIADGSMQAIALSKDDQPYLAVGVIRSALTQHGEMLEVVLTAGRDHRVWAEESIPILFKAARDAGMKGVRIIGRAGWQRALRNSGMKMRSVVMEMAA